MVKQPPVFNKGHNIVGGLIMIAAVAFALFFSFYLDNAPNPKCEAGEIPLREWCVPARKP